MESRLRQLWWASLHSPCLLAQVHTPFPLVGKTRFWMDLRLVCMAGLVKRNAVACCVRIWIFPVSPLWKRAASVALWTLRLTPAPETSLPMARAPASTNPLSNLSHSINYKTRQSQKPPLHMIPKVPVTKDLMNVSMMLPNRFLKGLVILDAISESLAFSSRVVRLWSTLWMMVRVGNCKFVWWIHKHATFKHRSTKVMTY